MQRVGERGTVYSPRGAARAPDPMYLASTRKEAPMSRPRISGQVAPQEVEDRTAGGGEGSKVFLFNCECHTFEDVITQLLKAVPGMTRPLAEELAWRVHTTGLAEVYRGGASDCDRVARILGETGLIVQVL